jgi:hypothetical protein
MSRVSSVGLARDYGTSRVRFPAVQGFPLLHSVRTLGPTQLPIKWLPGDLSPGIKRPGCEDGHSLPSSAEGENGGATPPLPVMSPWQSV